MIDRLAVTLVAVDGHRMSLDKPSALEAMRIMFEKGVSREVVAFRLCVSTHTIKAWMQQTGLKPHVEGAALVPGWRLRARARK